MTDGQNIPRAACERNRPTSGRPAGLRLVPGSDKIGIVSLKGSFPASIQLPYIFTIHFEDFSPEGGTCASEVHYRCYVPEVVVGYDSNL